jgi:predicted transcriptional regulator
MGQEEIYKFLSENKNTYFSINEIIEKTNDKNRSVVSRCCRKLRHFGMVDGETKNYVVYDKNIKKNKCVAYTAYKIK